jgi:hypothetical protein
MVKIQRDKRVETQALIMSQDDKTILLTLLLLDKVQRLSNLQDDLGIKKSKLGSLKKTKR